MCAPRAADLPRDPGSVVVIAFGAPVPAGAEAALRALVRTDDDVRDLSPSELALRLRTTPMCQAIELAEHIRTMLEVELEAPRAGLGVAHGNHVAAARAAAMQARACTGNRIVVAEPAAPRPRARDAA